MRCEDFRAAVLDGPVSDEALLHLRSCETCLTFAVEHDPDMMFRAIGGETEPPGGTEAFAAEVMHQIHMRSTERSFSLRESRLPAVHRWALAAAAAFMVVSGALFWPRGERVDVPAGVVSVSQQAAVVAPSAVRPVVEKWDSSSAMIIEIPEEETSDLKVVMVLLLADRCGMPSIADLARPIHRLAGLRISPETNGRQQLSYFTGLTVKHYITG